MKPTTHTLKLMRHSAGAVIAAAALAGHAPAADSRETTHGATIDAAPQLRSDIPAEGKEEKKDDGEKKKERDPCLGCGLG